MHYVKSIFLAIVVIVIAFVIISLFDVLISVVSSRFYSNAAFVVIFGVGGVFAGFYSYSMGYSFSSAKNNSLRWIVLITMIFTAAVFYFLLARYEKEYHMAFKSFAVTVTLTALFLGKTKLEI